jgi:hypothetical protein
VACTKRPLAAQELGIRDAFLCKASYLGLQPIGIIELHDAKFGDIRKVFNSNDLHVKYYGISTYGRFAGLWLK